LKKFEEKNILLEEKLTKNVLLEKFLTKIFFLEKIEQRHSLSPDPEMCV